MQPRLTPPGSRDVPPADRSFPWVTVSAVILLLATLFVVFILPSAVSPLSRYEEPPAQAQSPAQPAAIGHGESPGSQTHSLEDATLAPEQESLPALPATTDEVAEAAPAKQESVQPRESESDNNESDAAQTDEAQERFINAMSGALDALQQGNLAGARQALEQAEAAKPGSEAIKELRRQLASAELTHQLSDLARRAADRERKELWQDALELFDRALHLDPSAAFARTGRQRVSERLALEQAVDHYLRDPGRLQSPTALHNAKRLLQQLESLKEGTPSLSTRHQRLAGILAEAEMTLDVTIRSDGATEVVIYPVGRLGRFTLQALQLRPGTYTAVGTRAGFRDVRKVFVLAPGGNLDITVRCEETI